MLFLYNGGRVLKAKGRIQWLSRVPSGSELGEAGCPHSSETQKQRAAWLETYAGGHARSLAFSFQWGHTRCVGCLIKFSWLTPRGAVRLSRRISKQSSTRSYPLFPDTH